jgi:hypothetical protein
MLSYKPITTIAFHNNLLKYAEENTDGSVMSALTPFGFCIAGNLITEPSISVTISKDEVKDLSIGEIGDLKGTDNVVAEGESLDIRTAITFVANLESARKNLPAIIACFSVKTLRIKNLKGLYSSLSMPAPTAHDIELLTFMAAGTEVQWNSKEIINARAENKFIKYHTTAVSSGLLVQSAFSQLGKVGAILFSENDIKSAEESQVKYWESTAADGISQKALAITYIFFAIVPDNPPKTITAWYQGKRAYGTSEQGSMKRFETIIRKFQELNSDTSAIEAADSLEALIMLL